LANLKRHESKTHIGENAVPKVPSPGTRADESSQVGTGQKDSRRKKPETTKIKTMKIQIDLKSAVCGLIIGVAAMFVMGAEQSSSNQVGKYQVQAVPGENRIPGYAIIIDTRTGETWGMDAASDWHDYKGDKFWGTK
jgi:hypothetical protein